MLLDVTCKAGKLQVSEDGFVRVRQLLTGSIIWQIPCSTITRITSQDGFAMSSNIIFHTAQGQYQAEMVPKMQTSKIYALFPNLEVGAAQPAYQQQAASVPQQASVPTYKQAGLFHNKWYQDNKLRTYIVTYDDPKQMSKESAEAGQYGWIPQNTISTAGHFKRSFWIGLANSKDKITITYVRTPEWLAQNQ